MPFSIVADPFDPSRRCVASDDDVDEFDEMLDEFEDHPLLLRVALARYLADHPLHIDALAHVVMCSYEVWSLEHADVWLEAAHLALVSGFGSHPVALDRSVLGNRPVLRLVKNSVLLAWAAKSWVYADVFADMLTAVDPQNPDSAMIAAQVRAREDLEALVASV